MTDITVSYKGCECGGANGHGECLCDQNKIIGMYVVLKDGSRIKASKVIIEGSGGGSGGYAMGVSSKNTNVTFSLKDNP